MPGSGCFDFNTPLPSSLPQLIEAELAAERLSAGKMSVHISFSTLVPTFQLITHTEKVFRSAPTYIHEYVKWCGGVGVAG